MDPTRHVLLALTGGALIFFIAGGRAAKVQAQLKGEPVPETTPIDAPTIVGWGSLLLILVFFADIPTTGPLAMGFAWLIFLGIAFLYGEEAATKLASLVNPAGKNMKGPLPKNNVLSFTPPTNRGVA